MTSQPVRFKLCNIWEPSDSRLIATYVTTIERWKIEGIYFHNNSLRYHCYPSYLIFIQLISLISLTHILCLYNHSTKIVSHISVLEFKLYEEGNKFSSSTLCISAMSDGNIKDTNTINCQQILKRSYIGWIATNLILASEQPYTVFHRTHVLASRYLLSSVLKINT